MLYRRSSKLLPALDLLSAAILSKAADKASALGQARGSKRRALIQQLVSPVTVSDTAVTLALPLASIGVSGTASLIIPADIGRARARLTLVVPGRPYQTATQPVRLSDVPGRSGDR